MKSDLTVLTVVENDSGIFDLMIKSLYKFTNPAPNIIVCYNGGCDDMIDRHSADPNIKIVPFAPSLIGGSNKHGESLNKIFSLSVTSKTAIVESDCVIVDHNWDYINFPKHKMIASKKGEHVGHPFYHACFMVFSTGLLKHGKQIDFMPGKTGTRSNRPYKPFEDVGWAIRDYVRKDEVGSIDFVDCKSSKGKYFDSSFQSDEFWYAGRPICAHFGRGSNLAGKANRNGFDTHQEQLKRWKEVAERILA